MLHLFSFFVLLLTVQRFSDTKKSCNYAWKQALSFSNTFNIYIFWEGHKMKCGTDNIFYRVFLATLSPLLDCIASVMRLFSSVSALHTHQDQRFCSDIWAFVPVLMWLQMKWRMRQEKTEVLDGHPSILRNLQWASLWVAVVFVSLLGWLDTAYMVTGCLPLIFPSPNPTLLLFSISSYLLNSLNTPIPSLSPPLQVFLSSSSLSLSRWFAFPDPPPCTLVAKLTEAVCWR